MRTIAVVNQKGGVGKTTVSINLASAFAEAGQRTLLVDMDSQSHFAVGLAVPEEQIEQSIYDVLISFSRNEPIRLNEILWEITEHLELAPASIDLSAFEQQMAGLPGSEDCLKKVLDSIKDSYDVVVIDCPPAVGLSTFNALRAATDVIVPVETGYFSLHGLSKQLETLGILCQRFSQNLSVKVLASMYDIRTKMAREILGELRSHFGDKMLNTVVNFNTKLKEAASFGQPISEYDPASKGHCDFQALVQELLAGEPQQQRRQIVESLTDKLATIGATAEQLIERTKPQIKEIPPARSQSPKLEPAKPAAAAATEAKRDTAKTDAKLADYYGVNQTKDAVVFVTLYPRADNVQLAGDFNNWQPSKTPMQHVGETGVWQTEMKLPPGKYRYRLVVDGQWQQDPYNEITELNPFGGYNSIVEVR